MKIGAVGLGNRIAHVFHELSQINQEAKLVALRNIQQTMVLNLLHTYFTPKILNYQEPF